MLGSWNIKYSGALLVMAIIISIIKLTMKEMLANKIGSCNRFCIINQLNRGKQSKWKKRNIPQNKK
jgi:hypothetical protein